MTASKFTEVFNFYDAPLSLNSSDVRLEDILAETHAQKMSPRSYSSTSQNSTESLSARSTPSSPLKALRRLTWRNSKI
ncbi:MAG: hypothetical protein M1817_005538 [Caeruleum heppii]|nr:MAG: hypothetical protein M1817_005538 [Caeruleum heppii]